MTDPELLPCPFCGGDAAMGTGETYAFVNCVECLAATNHLMNCDTTRDEAIAAWNTRADLSTYAAGMRAMREAAAGVAIMRAKKIDADEDDWAAYTGDPRGPNAAKTYRSFAGALREVASAIHSIPVPEDDPVAELVRAAKDVHREALGWGISLRAVNALGAAVAKMEGRG